MHDGRSVKDALLVDGWLLQVRGQLMFTGVKVATNPVESNTPSERSFVQGPASLIRSIRDAVSRRAYEYFLRRGGTAGHDHQDWYAAEAELLHTVHVFLGETDEAFFLAAEVPGFHGNNLIINVEPRRVTIAGQRQAADRRCRGKLLRSDRCADQLLRVVELHQEVDSSRVGAFVHGGILEIELPKLECATRLADNARSVALVRAKDYKRWTYAVVQLLDGAKGR
jgi:HSP20 family molecular chaperone IbpA